jgi:hypothetical protein
MSEWWTYARIFCSSRRHLPPAIRALQPEIWPARSCACLGAGISRCRAQRLAQRCVAAILAAAWLYVAWAFHHERYATINWAAPYFAVAFAIGRRCCCGSVRGPR